MLTRYGTIARRLGDGSTELPSFLDVKSPGALV
jgi:hypothetical protein